MSTFEPSSLAIFGGTSAFPETLHVGRPNIGDRSKLFARLSDILDRGRLTNNGPCVQEFEQAIATLTGARHCICICNGTVALEIAVRALGLRGEVIIPSFTFPATAHCLQWQEITPVFCDVDPQTHCIDPNKIQDLITPRTSGIIGVHLWGRACDIEHLDSIARKHNLRLLFDAAHAFGCTYKDRYVGNFGDAEVFSFHATKFINTFEGGAVVTNDDELAYRIRLMKNFGFEGLDMVTHIGINGKMSEPCAAMGLTSLDSMEDFIKVNFSNYEKYRSLFHELPGFNLVNFSSSDKHNYQYIIFDIDEKTIGLSRDDLMQILQLENIRVRRYFYPGCHNMEPYRSLYPRSDSFLPETNKLCQRLLCFPNGTAITHSDIEKIYSLVRTIVLNASEIKRHLKMSS